MSEGYYQAMSGGTDSTVSQKKGGFWTGTWGAVVAALVTANLIQWFTDWSWWAYGAPAAGIAGLILVYAWAKERQRHTPTD